MNINNLRKEIDKCDSRILFWIAQRQSLVKKVALVKKDKKQPIKDSKREKQVINKAQKKFKNKINSSVINNIYKKIIFPYSYKIHKNARNKKTD